MPLEKVNCAGSYARTLFFKEDSTINRNIPVKPDKVSRDLVNEKIPFQQVMVIGPEGESLGVMKRFDALRASEEFGLDLLCVAPAAKPPVCKILDYGKFHFEKQKKDRVLARNKREAKHDEKEIQFKLMTSDRDLEIKAKMCKKYLEKGLKVKLSLFIRGRQITKKEIIEQMMNKMIDMLKDSGSPDKKPIQEGKTYICVVYPNKKSGGTSNAKDEN